MSSKELQIVHRDAFPLVASGIPRLRAWVPVWSCVDTKVYSMPTTVDLPETGGSDKTLDPAG